MRLIFGASALLAIGACALATAAAAQEQTLPPVVAPPVTAPPTISDAPPRPSVITNPSWARMPQARYPERALARGVEGRVRLECMVMPDGRLAACEILSEDPAGVGFGAEALIAAKETARVSPRTVDGAAVAALVTFNVDFRMAEPPAQPPPEQPSSPHP